MQSVRPGPGMQPGERKDRIMSVELEHWSSPNGCHPDCPACAAEAGQCEYSDDGKHKFEKDEDDPKGEKRACEHCGIDEADVRKPGEPFKFAPSKSIDGPGVKGGTNGERADRASATLDFYLFKQMKAPKTDSQESCNVSDLISDLGHYCDRTGMEFADFEDLVESALNRWREER